MEERYRWNILVMAYIVVVGFAFVFQSIPPILSLIIADLNFSHTQAGMLMSLFALPGIFLSIPGGVLSDHYGAKKISLAAFLLMISGTILVASGTSFLDLGLGRMLSGLGAVTLGIIASQVVTQWFIGQELGVAMGILNTAMPVGTIICLNTLGWLGKNFGWRSSVLVSTIAGLFALIIFLLLYRSAPPLPGQKPTGERASVLSRLSQSGFPIWVVGAAWMWFNAAVISFLTFGPDYFIARGYPIAFAGFLTSFLMSGSLVLSPVIGYLIDKFDAKKIFIGVGGILLALTIYLIPWTGTYLLFLMGLLSVAVALVPAPIFSLPADILQPQNLGLGFGIISTCLNVGVVLGPFLVGLMRDRTGSYQTSFLLMSGFALLATFTITGLARSR